MISAQEQIEMLENKKLREVYDRLTAVSHIQIEHFSSHNRIEGYYEDQRAGHLFGCDRLMKVDTMFSRLQMGYNPNRARSFIFANLKTSRYDTISSRYQKEMAEYQMKTLLKGQNENRGYISKYSPNASVLIEKAEAKPWTEQSINPYYNRINMDALKKAMPFFQKSDELIRLRNLRKEQMELRHQIAEQSRKGHHSENAVLYKKQLYGMQKENLLQALLYRKENQSRLFLRKINYAMDIQKHEMFEYYRDRRNQAGQSEEMIQDHGEDDNQDENS